MPRKGNSEAAETVPEHPMGDDIHSLCLGSLHNGVIVELIGHGFISAALDDLVRLTHAPSKAIVFANEAAAVGFLATHAALILQRIPLKFHPRSFEGGAS